MAHEHLTTYLNDHLAGSVVALELLDHLQATHAGSELGPSSNTSVRISPLIAMNFKD
jgi:hypothetical protein